MAKKSAVERNKNRTRLVRKNAARRARLKAMARDRAFRGGAFQGASATGRDAAEFRSEPFAVALRVDRETARQLPQIQDVACFIA